MGRAARFGISALVAASPPLALAGETVVRAFVMPPETAQLRVLAGPTATTVAWALAAAALVAAGLALWLQRRWCRAHLERAIARNEDPSRALLDRTFLSMSVPQVPAVLATMAFTAGSDLAPVLACMAVAAAAVLAQALQWERILAAAPHAGSMLGE
jgi:hypothetical protein